VGLYLTAFQVWSQIWDHFPHHFVVFSHNFVSFGQKIKVDIDLETGESRAHAYSIVVNRQPIPLVSAGSRFDLFLVSALPVLKIPVFFLNQDQKIRTNSYVDSGGK
jgi:hypothetical protein